MTAVPLGFSEYRRRDARTPEVALLNVLLEKDVTNQVDGMVRFQRPGLTEFTTVGEGPIRKVFRKAGVLGSDYLVVSGQKLYRVTAAADETLLGTVHGTDVPIIDGSATRAVIVANGLAYSTNGTNLGRINMPDDVEVSSVVYIAGYFVLTQKDSQRFYWLAPGDVDPDPLNFASAENGPDNIIRGARLLDELWFFGEQTTEVFSLTGNLDAPFQPIVGRLYEKGCANKDSVGVLDNTLFWVGNDLIAYRADTTPIRISDHSMEERFRTASPADLRAWAFALDGHSIYCIRVGSLGSFVFDIENPNWGRWKSYGQETWRAHVGTQIAGDLIIAGDDMDGTLWRFDHTVCTDDGAPMEREVTGGIAILGSPQKCRDFSVMVAPGWAHITGSATNPLLQMRFSDDGGNLWSSWIEMPLGLQGQYNTEVVWRQLGIMRAPGRLFTIRMTDDSLFRISFARINEAQSI